MIRLLGAITGSALALATLLVFVGVPQFKFDSTEPADVEQSVVTLPLPTQPVETLVETADRDVPEPADPLPALIEDPTPEPVVSTGPPVETDIAPEFSVSGSINSTSAGAGWPSSGSGTYSGSPNSGAMSVSAGDSDETTCS